MTIPTPSDWGPWKLVYGQRLTRPEEYGNPYVQLIADPEKQLAEILHLTWADNVDDTAIAGAIRAINDVMNRDGRHNSGWRSRDVDLLVALAEARWPDRVYDPRESK